MAGKSRRAWSARSTSTLFCARLDMAVDGDANTAIECNTQVEPPERNPWGNAYFEEEDGPRERDGGGKTGESRHPSDTGRW